MLYTNNVRVIEGVTIYGDDKKINVFYPLPMAPRFRVDEEGKPIFNFIKYRFPIDRGEGKKGGGYVVFATELSIPEDKMKRIKEKLQPEVADAVSRLQKELKKAEVEVKQARERLKELQDEPGKIGNAKKALDNAIDRKERLRKKIEDNEGLSTQVQIGTIRYTKGTTRILLNDENNVMVERIFEAGVPSLFGKNIAAFSIELSDVGATFFEQALQGKGAFIVVVYELYYEAKLPPLTVTAKFHAESFYSFVQKINVEERVCAEDDYKETLSEIMTKSESKEFHLDPGGSQIEPKVIDQIRSWAQGSLDDAVERLMIEALPVENPADARKWYQENDFEDVKKEVTRSRISDFTLHYKEEAYIEVNINPQDPLPNITNLKDKEGNAIVWEEYFKVVDLDDKFFKQINATVKVNAPFDQLPIHSVEVKLTYKGEPMDVIGSEVNGEFQFSKADDVARFATFIKDDDFNYSYSYQVNYKGASKIFQSEEMTTDESVLTVNIDDVGILFVEIIPGDIDFQKVKQAHITMEYEDTANGVEKITDQFIMNAEMPEHKFEHIIFSKRSKPYRYKVNYKMADGTEIESEWQEANSNRLYINDMFTESKTVGFRASGNLETEISNIFIDARYEDPANNYVLTQSIALSKDVPFFDWFIPIMDQNINTITYKGHIIKKDGTQEEIPETTTDASTIIVGENVENIMNVTVRADLLDFVNTLKIALIELKYEDAENDVFERKDFTFKEGALAPQTWTIELKDKSKNTYKWKATFFKKDDSKIETEAQDANDLTLFLELPSN